VKPISPRYIARARQKAFEACGDPNKRMCILCKKWDNPDKMLIQANVYYKHRECQRSYRRWLRVQKGLNVENIHGKLLS